MFRRIPAAFALLLFLVLSCTDGGLAPARDRGTVQLRPQFTEMAGGGYSASLPIHRIRLTARDAATSTLLETLVVTVDPNQTSWQIPFEIRLTSNSVVVVVSIELVNVTDGIESVQWSGRTQPLTVTAAAVTEQSVPVFPGPLANLDVTSVEITTGIESVFEGDALRLAARAATTSGTAAVVVWRSLTPAIATVTADGQFTALAPGTAQIVAQAGPASDEIGIQVLARPARIILTPTSAQLSRLGEEIQLRAVVEDARGAALDHAIAWSISSGNAVEHLGDGRFRAVASGPAVVRAAAADIDATAQITVTQTPAQITLTPANVELSARGATAQLQAVVEDAGGSRITDPQITWASSNTDAATVSATGLVTAIADGTAVITATAGSVSARSNVRVQRVPRAVEVVAGAGQSARVGTAVTVAPAVRVADANNQPMSSIAVEFAVTAGAGSLTGATAVTGADGVARVNGWTLGERAGTNTITATVAGLAPVEISATGVAGPAARIVIVSGDAQSGVVNTTLLSPLVVRVTDALDNNVAGETVTFDVSSNGGTLSAGQVVTDSDGRAAVQWTLPSTSGTGTVTARLGTIGAVTFTATARASLPARFELIAGGGQSGGVGSALLPPVVAVVDEFGNGVGGIAVTFAVTAGGGSVTGAFQTTESGGSAQPVTWTLGPTPGTNILTATATGISPLEITATAVAGAAAQLSIVAGNNQSATVGTAVAVAPAVRVQDAHGNNLQNVAVTFAVTSGGGSVSGGNATTDANGIARVASWTLGQQAGGNTLTASSGSLSTVQFHATGTPGPAVAISIVSGNNQTGAVNTTLSAPLVVRVADSFNNAVAGATVTFAGPTNGGSLSASSATTDANGHASVQWTLSATAGTGTVTASINSTASVTFTATGVVTTPGELRLIEGGGQTGVVGTSLTPPLVEVRDAFGNAAAGVTVTFTVTSGGGSVTEPTQVTDVLGRARPATWTLGTTPGTNVLTASAAGVPSLSISATAVAGPAAQLTIHEGNNQSAAVGTAVAIAPAVRVQDAYGNDLQNVTVTFAVASGGGSVTGASAVSDASGVARVGSWTLGSSAGENTLTATVGSLSVTFTATAVTSCTDVALTASTVVSSSFAGGCVVGGVPTRTFTFDMAADGIFTVFLPTPLAYRYRVERNGVTIFQHDLSAVQPYSFAHGASAGAFRITLQPLDPASTASFDISYSPGSHVVCEPVHLVRPVTLSAALESSGCVSEGHGMDSYMVHLNAGAVVAATITSSAPVHVMSNGALSDALTSQTVTFVAPETGPYHFGVFGDVGTTYSLVLQNAPPPTSMVVHAGNNQTAPANTVLPVAPAVRVTDATGQPVRGLPVSFAVTAGGGNVFQPVVLTNENGVAEAVDWLLGPTVGTNTVTASTVGLPAVVFTATAVDPCPVAALALGSQLTSEFSTSGCTVNGVPTNFYSLELASASVFNIDLPTAIGYNIMFLQGNTPFFGYSNAVGQPFSFHQALPAGSYVMRIQPVDGTSTGSYTVAAAAGQLSGCRNIITPLDISVGQTLSDTDCLSGDAYQDRWSFPPLQEPNSAVTVSVSASAPVSLLARRTDGTVITSVHNSTSPVITFDPGNLFSHVVVFAATSGATYTMSITRVLPPTSVAIHEGDGQSANAGTAVPVAPAVIVRNANNEPVPGVGVVFAVASGGGSVTSATTRTNASGIARVGSWTVGEGTNTLTAQAAGVATGVTFTATGVPATPTLSAALVDRSFIGVSFSGSLRVTSNQAAPAGGLLVTVTSSDPSKLTVASPGSVTIPEGQTQATITLNGVAAGTVTVTASATGFTAASLSVPVSLRLISLPATLNVPFGGTASLPVQLAEPAPAGGTVVTLVSSDATRVSLSSTTVTVPAGALAANATLNGVYPGPATITASASEYIGASTSATTRANLNVLHTAISFSVGFPTTTTVQFESSGSDIAAPAGGVPVTITSRNSACAVAPNVTIAAGLTSATINVDYGGTATTQCVTWLVAAAPDIAPDSVQVTVNPPPAIVLGNTTVGAGLQRSRPTGHLQISAHGGAVVTLVSSDPSRLLLAPNAATAGTETLQVTVPNGQSNIPFYVQGMDGVTGNVTVTASATNFASASMTVSVVTPGIEMHGLPGTTTTLSPKSNIYAQVGIPCNTSYLCEVQNRRAGGSPIPVTFTTPDTTTAGRLVTSADTGTSVIAHIQPQIYYTPTSITNGGATFQPLLAGPATITATAAGFTTLTNATRSVSVSMPGISVSGTTIGSGLMRSRPGASLGAGAHGGITVRVTSSDPALLLVSPNASTAGAAFIDVPVADGATNVPFYVHGLEGVTGTATVTLSAPGFSNGAANFPVVQPGIELHGVPSSTTTLSSNPAIYAQVGLRNSTSTYLVEVQNLRAGATPLKVSFATPDSNVVRLITSRGTADTASATINAGIYYTPTTASAGVAMEPNNAGSTTIAVSAPGFVAVSNATRSVTVTQSTINLSATTVGAGLQRSRAAASLSASDHGGVTVTLVSSDSSRILLSPNSSTAGTGTIQVNVAAGATNIPFYVQGVENTTGTSTITASAPGFSTATVTYTVVQPAIQIFGLSSTTTTLSAQDDFWAQIGIANSSQQLIEVQNVRAGGTPVVVTFTSSTTAAQLVTNAATGGTVTATIPVGLYYTPTAVTGGGVALRPLTGGTTRVNASAPNILSGAAYQDVTVSAPSINMSATTVGAGLMRSRGSASLGASNHGGVTVRIKSSNGSVALVSPNASTAGTDSIDLVVAAGATNIPFYVHGVDGATGTVSITATAAGFTDGSATATVVTPGVELVGLNGSMNLASNDDASYAQVGLPCNNNSSLCEVQNRRAGQPALQVTVTSTHPAVAPLITASDTAGTVTVNINAGLYYSPTNVAAGGFAVRALGVGTSTVSASIPAFTPMATASRSITVVNASVNTTAATVGAGLQRARPSSSLSGPNHGGVTVRVTSTDPSRVLVSPNATTAGAAFIDIVVPHGSTGFSYYVQGVEGMTGSVAVTAEVTGWTSSTATWALVQPAVEIHGLPATATAGGSTDAFYAQVGIPRSDLTSLAEVQNVRAGVSPVTVTFTSSSGTVAQISTSGGTADSGTASIASGIYHTPTSIAGGGVGFVPRAAGSVTISASAPGFRTVTISSRTVTVQ